ncbi:proline-rich nuclear receptor coactivator 2-like [Choloepus didactylus]|uniref:proline-rich nuclear receptor coactivator 2-like n=1 Tax=Choloepus didactylus TaxID=27675 RepID=UPI00189EB6B1|nr:proline-rich nuclear receptor coactivator 2-like [Choloepus didactylus]
MEVGKSEFHKAGFKLETLKRVILKSGISELCRVGCKLKTPKKIGGEERYNIPVSQSGNVSKNQQQLNTQKTKDQNSQMKIVHKKKERGHGYNSSAAAWQATHNEGKNKVHFSNNQNWNSSLSSSSLLFKSQTSQNYAGAKFSEPPSPSILPKPLSHWIPVSFNSSDKEIMTFQPKILLKVQV